MIALTLDLYTIYLLNLLVMIAMFIVLIFRAWIELKNFKIMWKEMERRRANEVVSKILRAEKDLFTRVEGGQELYDLLRTLFDVEEK